VKELVLGTRGSALARAQSELVAAALRALGLGVHLAVIATRGDRDTSAPVRGLGGIGFFTSELEQALLARRVDVAVHSLKDLPTRATAGLLVAAVPKRDDWRDALVSRHPGGFRGLPPRARVGTASLRRRSLLLNARPDLEIVDLRGNVDTRLERVAQGELDAVVVAAAGLVRLGRADAIAERLEFLPAPGQGALAVQAHADRDDVVDALRALHDPRTDECVQAERALLAALEGGCSVPVGALAVAEAGRIRLEGCVGSVDGRTVLRVGASGDEPQALGWDVAHKLRAMGAEALLRA